MKAAERQETHTAKPPPVIIRPEINLLNIPFFSLSRRGLKDRRKIVYTWEEMRGGERALFEWIVTANAEYGYPGPFDRRVFRGIDAVIYEHLEQYGYPLENPLPFSMYRLAEILGYGTRGGKIYRDIRDSLRRIKLTGVESKGSFFLKDQKTYIHQIFSLLDKVVFRHDKMEDGTLAETNYIWFGEPYLDNINAQHVRPLDYNYLVSLDSDVAGRMYEVLTAKFYGLLRKNWRAKKLEIRYRKMCQSLPVTPQKYLSLAQQTLQGAHAELMGHTGNKAFLSDVGWREGVDDWILMYSPGRKAREEARGTFPKKIVVPRQVFTTKTSDTVPLNDTGQVLHELGFSREKARDLSMTYITTRIKEVLDMYRYGSIKSLGGIVKALKEGWTASEPQKEKQKKAAYSEAAGNIAHLTAQKRNLEKEYQSKTDRIFKDIMTQEKAAYARALDDAIAYLVQKGGLMKEWYDPAKPVEEQRHAVQGFLATRIKYNLRQHFAERFEALEREYKEKIEHIDRKMNDIRRKATQGTV